MGNDFQKKLGRVLTFEKLPRKFAFEQANFCILFTAKYPSRITRRNSLSLPMEMSGKLSVKSFTDLATSLMCSRQMYSQVSGVFG